jgi:hypothetical protein
MYPLGESNPCSRTENPMSWATRRRGQTICKKGVTSILVVAIQPLTLNKHSSDNQFQRLRQKYVIDAALVNLRVLNVPLPSAKCSVPHLFLQVPIRHPPKELYAGWAYRKL